MTPILFVEGKRTHYLFTCKYNQPSLRDVEALNLIDFSPAKVSIKGNETLGIWTGGPPPVGMTEMAVQVNT